MKNIKEKLDCIKARFCDADFLANKGIGNEVGIHIFCYDPKDELAVQSFLKILSAETNVPFRIVEKNLYTLFLEHLDEKRILKSVETLEEKKGKGFIQEQLQKKSHAEALLHKIDYAPHDAGDILCLTGVGQIFPHVRTHNMLDSMQRLFEDMPIVVFYPGNFNGRELELFGLLFDGNYYRAFNLI